jgi:hypothetical protein
MTTQEFNALFEQTVEMCRETLCHKAAHYTEDNDRLHNFAAARNLQGNTLLQAIAGMMAKHTVSVYDLIRKIANGESVSRDMWEEKIVDNINYLIILWAAINHESA